VERSGQQRRDDGSGEEPDYDGVPLPGPEDLGGCPGVYAHQVNEFVRCDRRRAGSEEDLASAKVDQHQRELDGEAEMVGDLRCDEVQAGEEGYAERE